MCVLAIQLNKNIIKQKRRTDSPAFLFYIEVDINEV
jgi:hypothetical protein